MKVLLLQRRGNISFRAVAVFIVIALIISGLTLYFSGAGRSRSSVLPYMSAPTELLTESPRFDAPVLRGIKLYSDNPFRFDFIIDEGGGDYSKDELKSETAKLIRYFLAALTIPKQDLWVNLSPYESDKIAPEELGMTDMGRDLLGEDYVLKQLASSLTYPETSLGRQFWKRVYQKAYELYGTTDIPFKTFSKVWIVPESAVIYQDKDKAFIEDSRLKVMLEEDYLAERKNASRDTLHASRDNICSDVFRQTILPEIERDINQGKNFAILRQVYHSLLLATWFKRRLSEGILAKIYLDKKKIKGVDLDDPELKHKIYAQYVEAYKKGVYNYVKKDYDLAVKKRINRRYYSGGMGLTGIDDVEKKSQRPWDEDTVGRELAAIEKKSKTTIELDDPDGVVDKDGIIGAMHDVERRGAASAEKGKTFTIDKDDEDLSKKSLEFVIRTLEEELRESKPSEDAAHGIMFWAEVAYNAGWASEEDMKYITKFVGYSYRAAQQYLEFAGPRERLQMMRDVLKQLNNPEQISDTSSSAIVIQPGFSKEQFRALSFVQATLRGYLSKRSSFNPTHAGWYWYDEMHKFKLIGTRVEGYVYKFISYAFNALDNMSDRARVIAALERLDSVRLSDINIPAEEAAEIPQPEGELSEQSLRERVEESAEPLSNNLYTRLGLSPQASQRHITVAYRVLAKRYHPDSTKKDDLTPIINIIAAYKVLSDPKKRSTYDSLGVVGAMAQGGEPGQHVLLREFSVYVTDLVRRRYGTENDPQGWDGFFASAAAATTRVKDVESVESALKTLQSKGAAISDEEISRIKRRMFLVNVNEERLLKGDETLGGLIVKHKGVLKVLLSRSRIENPTIETLADLLHEVTEIALLEKGVERHASHAQAMSARAEFLAANARPEASSVSPAVSVPAFPSQAYAYGTNLIYDMICSLAGGLSRHNGLEAINEIGRILEKIGDREKILSVTEEAFLPIIHAAEHGCNKSKSAAAVAGILIRAGYEEEAYRLLQEIIPVAGEVEAENLRSEAIVAIAGALEETGRAGKVYDSLIKDIFVMAKEIKYELSRLEAFVAIAAAIEAAGDGQTAYKVLKRGVFPVVPGAQAADYVKARILSDSARILTRAGYREEARGALTQAAAFDEASSGSSAPVPRQGGDDILNKALSRLRSLTGESIEQDSREGVRETLIQKAIPAVAAMEPSNNKRGAVSVLAEALEATGERDEAYDILVNTLLPIAKKESSDEYNRGYSISLSVCAVAEVLMRAGYREEAHDILIQDAFLEARTISEPANKSRAFAVIARILLKAGYKGEAYSLLNQAFFFILREEQNNSRAAAVIAIAKAFMEAGELNYVEEGGPVQSELWRVQEAFAKSMKLNADELRFLALSFLASGFTPDEMTERELLSNLKAFLKGKGKKNFGNLIALMIGSDKEDLSFRIEAMNKYFRAEKSPAAKLSELLKASEGRIKLNLDIDEDGSIMTVQRLIEALNLSPEDVIVRYDVDVNGELVRQELAGYRIEEMSGELAGYIRVEVGDRGGELRERAGRYSFATLSKKIADPPQWEKISKKADKLAAVILEDALSLVDAELMTTVVHNLASLPSAEDGITGAMHDKTHRKKREVGGVDLDTDEANMKFKGDSRYVLSQSGDLSFDLKAFRGFAFRFVMMERQTGPGFDLTASEKGDDIGLIGQKTISH